MKSLLRCFESLETRSLFNRVLAEAGVLSRPSRSFLKRIDAIRIYSIRDVLGLAVQAMGSPNASSHLRSLLPPFQTITTSIS